MSLIFQTQNTPLAVTLLTCGVKVPRDAKGLPIPFMNVYDAKTLKEHGYGGGRWTLESAARDAWQTGKPGIIVYNFLRCDLQERIVTAWNKQSALINEQAFNEGNGGVVIGEIKLDPYEAAKFACQLFKNRKQTIEDWKVVTPFVLVAGESRIESDTGEGKDRRVEVVGSYSGYFLNASKEDRAHLKV